MNDLIAAINQLAQEKGIDKEVLFQAIETSLVTACKKNFGTSENIYKVNMDRDTGEFKVYADKTVVEDVEDDKTQISLEDARRMNADFAAGDICQIEVTPKNFGRIAAQNAKQIVIQKINEAERSVVYEEYKSQEREMVSGLVQRIERGNVYINLGKIEAVLEPREQIPGEIYPMNKRIKVYIKEVRKTNRGPLVYASRTNPEFIKRLFEQEVPEIHDGIVVIKSIAREAGSRSKMAVWSRDPMVDPLGACVGPNGSRVNAVNSELNGEKIDIVIWNEEPARFIQAALSPAEVERVEVDKDTRSATVTVPDFQLSLAIGKEGQNARLAAKLTSYRIDIKSESQMNEEAQNEEYEYEYEFVEDEDDEDEIQEPDNDGDEESYEDEKEEENGQDS